MIEWQYLVASLGQQVRAMPTTDYGWLLFFLTVVVFIALYAAFKANRQRLFLINTPRSKIRSAAQGFVEIAGQAAQLEQVPPVISII